jgi:lysophospholipase L1-like esterase
MKFFKARQFLTFFAAGLLFAASQGAMAADKRVLVFGDSNCWGWSPVEAVVPVTRYPSDVRWTGIMQSALGAGYKVVEECLSARTAASVDNSLGLAGAGLNGLEYLPAAIASQTPLDLVVIVLGTNDVKPSFGKSALEISTDILRLVTEAQKNAGIATTYKPAKVLVVAPPPLGKISKVEWVQKMFPDESVKKSKELGTVLGSMTRAAGVPFFDASTVISSMDGVDGIHMTAASHAKLGRALADEVKKAVK